VNIGLEIPLFLLLVSALLSLHIFFLIRSRAGASRSAWILAGLMVATSAWALLNALEFLVAPLSLKILFSSFEYLPISAIPVLLFRLGTRLYRADDASRPGIGSAASLLWLEPLLTSVLVWFDPALGLVRRDFRIELSLGFPTLAFGFGPWFWLHASYDYALIALATARIILALGFGSQGRRAQAWLLCFAALVPFLANLAFIVGLWPLPALDPTPIAFTITGGAFLLMFSRFRFLSILPVARDVALTGLREGILVMDREGNLVFVNDSAAGLLGITRVEAGRNLDEIAVNHPVFSELPRRWGEERVLRVPGEGEMRHLEVRCEPVLRGRRAVASIHSIHDITRRVRAEEELRAANDDLERRISEGTAELRTMNERLTNELEQRKETEKQLFYFSLHDPLTGLPNRSLLLNRLGQAIVRIRREPVPPFAILYFDFDNFKHINDSHGHAGGDSFLREAGTRLVGAVRGIDTVSRIGSDEFVVLLDKVKNVEEAREAGDRLASELSMPIRLGANTVIPSVSVGILCATVEYSDPSELLHDADLAMYHAKAEGKNRRVIFDAPLRAASLERTKLLNDLNRTVLESGIELAYQPLVRLSNGAVVGCEALARWNHPELGKVSPGRFIPLAEEGGLIVPLGLFVIMEACRTAAAMKEIEGLTNIFIAVNVSALQLAHPDFALVLGSALERHGLAAEAIHLEITESALVERTDAILPLLHELRERGFHLKLDDFGTGYSSLAYLHRIPVDTIKIDQSFVRDLDPPGGRAALASGGGILKSIIAVGHELGHSIVAEGIETEVQARLLSDMGCDIGQGWLYGRPLTRDAWLARLADEVAEGLGPR
jgi:diguanylate cyclase (GGDEF)-like protein/PAS domain S-box-containing protein